MSAHVGELNPRARLTESDVWAIKDAYARHGDSVAHLARKYRVTRQNVDSIVKGRTWRHLLEQQQGAR